MKQIIVILACFDAVTFLLALGLGIFVDGGWPEPQTRQAIAIITGVVFGLSAIFGPPLVGLSLEAVEKSKW